ncbi:MAG: hypothetical protein JWO38_7912 [Gemmataceae bacterium]|nr:hypothetical protein [Gemmataceae bacterium]
MPVFSRRRVELKVRDINQTLATDVLRGQTSECSVEPLGRWLAAPEGGPRHKSLSTKHPPLMSRPRTTGRAALVARGQNRRADAKPTEVGPRGAEVAFLTGFVSEGNTITAKR